MKSVKLLPLRKLFAAPYFFRLPAFQRHYAWDPRLARKLLHGILEFETLKTDSERPRHYSLGVMLLYPHKADVPGPLAGLFGRRNAQIFDVIDGQQRLITLTLLLCVLRDLLPADMTKDLTAAIEGSKAANVPFRIALNEDDDDALTTYARAPGATFTRLAKGKHSETVRNIAANCEAFHDILGPVAPTEALRAIADYVLDYCGVVVIEANEDDDPNQLYNTLNDGGVRLHRSSQLKAYVFPDVGGASSPEMAALAREWNTWERDLGVGRLDRILSIVRAIHGNMNKPVVEENRRLLEKAGGAEGYLTNYVRPAVHAFQRIERAPQFGSKEHPEIRKYLCYLNWMEDTDWYGPVFEWFRHERTDEDSIAFLKRLDRCVFTVMMKGTNNKDRARRFKRIANKIDANGLAADCHDIELADKEQTRALFRISNDFQRLGGRSCKLLLLRLCDVISGELTTSVPQKLTIEHVLPRKVSKKSEWVSVFGSTDERDLRFRRLANLVLLSEASNREADNKGFDVKKEIIFGEDGAKLTPYAVTNYLLDCERWDPDTIDQREDELIEMVRSMWTLKGPAGRETDR